MSSRRKSVWRERKSTALICGNTMLPVQFGRPVASRSCCQNKRRRRTRTSSLVLRALSGKKESVALFLFLCPDRKQNNGCFGKWGLELEIPLLLSCSLALGRSRAASRKSVGRVRAPQDRKKKKKRPSRGGLTLLLFRGTNTESTQALLYLSIHGAHE